jgi:hypothetical protein
MNLFISKAILPNFLKKLINIFLYRGYSAYLVNYSFDRKIVKSKNSVLIKGLVKNNGWHEKLTCYVIYTIIDPYKPDEKIFESDINLEFEEKRNFLLYDIIQVDSRAFAFSHEIPENLESPILYIKIDIWSPRKLYRKKNFFYYPFLFDTSGWKGFVELVPQIKTTEMIRIFFSYAWVSNDHIEWVHNLADLLSKQGFEILIDRDLLAGQEITKFMEHSINSSDIVLLICSDKYTEKANGRIGGAGYETVLTTRQYYLDLKKERFIPIVRDNALPNNKKLPDFLGTTLYIDMDNKNWHGEAFQKLLKAIRNQLNK